MRSEREKKEREQSAKYAFYVQGIFVHLELCLFYHL